MGAFNSKSDSETINWNGLNTENISSSLPTINKLSQEAKQLIASLNIPEITESETSEFTVGHIIGKIDAGLNKQDKQLFGKLMEEVSQTNSDELSNTSPFISSEMYNHLVNSATSEKEQQGGANQIRKIKSKGGALLDDDSDTSSTSSDSSLEDMLDSTEEDVKKHNREKKEKKDKKHKKSKFDSDSELSGGDLSYLSSSAHTDRNFSESDKKHTSSVQSSSVTESSVTYEKNGMIATSVSHSIDTDDINMISDY
jgi:hypothetical protein